ncbi:MAG: hypothetical protein EON54_19215, partial [Alcaligenaceae bacterium]
MKELALVISAAVFLSGPAFANGKSGDHSGMRAGPTRDHTVRSHSNDGKTVVRHHATNRNDTKADNYSTKGNVNPYT